MGFADMIILDTHIWLWWVNQDSAFLKPLWLEMIGQADEVGVSAISLFEVAWLQQHGRIQLPCELNEWFEKALAGSGISLRPLTPAIAKLAVSLTDYHSDPQDRIIIATAIAHDGGIISVDKKFPYYPELENRLIT
ncbi:MAG: type II toxin-antitoxin system VapC family toxin [Methylococcales bacterium]|nr:type II toxin-antitoxin system VapC family toxin [Methylococcales bacterium]